MRRDRSDHGFTLLEALIALAIFGLIAVMATTGVVGALRAQSLNEAIASSQGRVRRVTEVFAQDLRSSVLGGLTNTPYASNDHQVSFLTLAGSGGNKVLPHDYGQGNSFSNADNLFLVWSDPNTAATSLQGQHVLLVNDNGDATVFQVTNVAPVAATTYRYNVVHAGCPNLIAYTDARTTALASHSVGYRFDAGSGTLYLKDGSSAETPVAFDLSNVAIQYVYQTDAGAPLVRSAPLTDASGYPVRTGTISGQNVTLERVGLVVTASDGSAGRRVSRTVSSQVEMSSNPSFKIDKVTPCN
ncbi:MAG TPA: prepilin-type N-terminal cleavage/methylation domain-containing protein [Trueperaceae bacterium]|nr:prepilin-type N-terminal cleavage/methylation domain-containing protein [Trueperaceae bacterium]